MKKITFTLAIFLTCILQSFGQVNPIVNLTWSHNYQFPNNYFILEWDEPAAPHDELVGYNVYRENNFYMFLTETSLYNVEQGSNSGGEDFLFYNNGEGFSAYVTAVYNPGAVESTSETVEIDGLLLNINNIKNEKAILYPNPTRGILNIGNNGLIKILIYDSTGKKIKEMIPKSQIDLSDISKGVYLIKLISEEGILVDKIIVK
jgi:hypothetical protein